MEVLKVRAALTHRTMTDKMATLSLKSRELLLTNGTILVFHEEQGLRKGHGILPAEHRCRCLAEVSSSFQKVLLDDNDRKSSPRIDQTEAQELLLALIESAQKGAQPGSKKHQRGFTKENQTTESGG